MARWPAHDDRFAQGLEVVQQHGIQLFGRCHVSEAAQHKTPGRLQRTGVFQLAQQPVNTVGLFVDVFHEEQCVLGVEGPGRAHQGAEQTEVATDQNAFSNPLCEVVC